jgi:hypothetical protein
MKDAQARTMPAEKKYVLSRLVVCLLVVPLLAN